jgi:hypothetical protein
MSITTLARAIRPFFTLSGASEPLTFMSAADCGGVGFEYRVAGNKRMMVTENRRISVEYLII